jgi:hypothetical protein
MLDEGLASYNAPAGNKFNYVSVSPDVLSVVIPSDQGLFKLDGDFDPESTTVTVRANNGVLPDWSNKLILINNANTFLLFKVDASVPAIVVPGVTIQYALIDYATINPVFKSYNTPFTAYQTNGNTNTTNKTLMSNITQATGFAREISSIRRFFAAPDAIDHQLYLYETVNYDTVDDTHRLGGPIIDFQVNAIFQGDFSNPYNHVDSMLTSKDISHLLVNFEGGTQENRLYASGTIPLRGTKGGNIDTSLSSIDATPSLTPYSNGDKSGPAVLVKHGTSFAVLRALLSPVPGQPGLVTGKLKFTDHLGNDFTPINNTMPVPATSIFRMNTSGSVLVTLMRVWNPNTNGFQAHLMEIVPDPVTGEITQTSVIQDHVLSSPHMKSPTAAISGYDAGSNSETLMLLSADTEGIPPATSSVPATQTRHVELYYRPMPVPGDPVPSFTLAGSYAIDLKANRSTVISGASYVPIDSTMGAVTVATSEATYGTTNKRGSLYIFPVHKDSLLPLSASNNGILGTRTLANINGPVGAWGPVPTSSDNTTSAYALDGALNTRYIKNTALIALVNQYLGSPGVIPLNLKTYSEKDGVVYCGNTLGSDQLSTYYKQTSGNNSFTIHAPLVKSAAGYVDDGTGTLKTFFSTGAPMDLRDILYAPPINSSYAATMLASIAPNAILNRAKVAVLSNTQNISSGNSDQEMFVPLMPETNLTSPCPGNYPPLPHVNDDASGIDASSLMAMSGSLSPGSTDSLYNIAAGAQDAPTPAQYFLGDQAGYTSKLGNIISSFSSLNGGGGGGVGKLGGGGGGGGSLEGGFDGGSVFDTGGGGAH